MQGTARPVSRGRKDSRTSPPIHARAAGVNSAEAHRPRAPNGTGTRLLSLSLRGSAKSWYDKRVPTAEPLRDSIISSVMTRASRNGGFVTRADLSWVSLPSGEGRRVIDAARGIWNPRDMDATLSVVSSPTGPYADREVEGGLFHYSYRDHDPRCTGRDGRHHARGGHRGGEPPASRPRPCARKYGSMIAKVRIHARVNTKEVPLEYGPSLLWAP